MSEECSYLDSSAENCGEIESQIPITCESDRKKYLTLEPAESEALQRQG